MSTQAKPKLMVFQIKEGILLLFSPNTAITLMNTLGRLSTKKVWLQRIRRVIIYSTFKPMRKSKLRQFKNMPQNCIKERDSTPYL